MSSSWETLKAAMGDLLAICTTEQEALVTMQAEKVALCQNQKAGALSTVHRIWSDLAAQAASAPRDVLAMADQCRRINETNRSMLSLTLKCIDQMMNAAGATRAATYGPSGAQAMQRGFMDVRI